MSTGPPADCVREQFLSDWEVRLGETERCLEARREKQDTYERDLVAWKGLLSRAVPGALLGSFSSSFHADLTWRLAREDILRANAEYPLESLWCTNGSLRCRLVVFSQGHFVRAAVTPSSLPGFNVEHLDMHYSLKCTELEGTEPRILQSSTLTVDEQDWDSRCLVIELSHCPREIQFEAKVHTYVALLTPATTCDAGADFSVTELVPSSSWVDEVESSAQTPAAVLIGS